jgi:endonuclease YncB( thermonuclease family)
MATDRRLLEVIAILWRIPRRRVSSSGGPLIAAVAALLFSVMAYAQELTGLASVVDGDTLEIYGIRIRLYGIDAPEATQTCTNAQGTAYRCGRQAARALDDLVGRRTVTCAQRDTDQYGRPVAICRQGIVDLGAWMVDHGHAVAFMRYSDRYAPNEATARAKSIGLWSGTFERPWDYRAKLGQASAQAVPDSKCAIKGNVNAKGLRLYHVPGSRDYEATRIDQSKGERWFCTENEALSAGWRKAR